MIAGRKQASEDAQAKYLADVALAANFDELLADAQAAEKQYRAAQATAAPLAEQYWLAKRLDAALTDVMRSGYAAVRAEIGPRGYDDRIYKRKAMATPVVHALNTRGRTAADAARDAPADRHTAPAGGGRPAAGTPDGAQHALSNRSAIRKISIMGLPWAGHGR